MPQALQEALAQWAGMRSEYFARDGKGFERLGMKPDLLEAQTLLSKLKLQFL